MKLLLHCRRTAMALISISILGAMAFLKGIDTSAAIAAIAVGLAGANAAEGALKSRPAGAVYRRPDEVE